MEKERFTAIYTLLENLSIVERADLKDVIDQMRCLCKDLRNSAKCYEDMYNEHFYIAYEKLPHSAAWDKELDSIAKTYHLIENEHVSKNVANKINFTLILEVIRTLIFVFDVFSRGLLILNLGLCLTEKKVEDITTLTNNSNYVIGSEVISAFVDAIDFYVMMLKFLTNIKKQTTVDRGYFSLLEEKEMSFFLGTVKDAIYYRAKALMLLHDQTYEIEIRVDLNDFLTDINELEKLSLRILVEKLSVKGTVSIYYWPSTDQDGTKDDGGTGHIALRTYIGGDDGCGHYISFWPDEAAPDKAISFLWDKFKGKEYQGRLNLFEEDFVIHEVCPFRIDLDGVDIGYINAMFEMDRMVVADGRSIWSLCGKGKEETTYHNCCTYALDLLYIGLYGFTSDEEKLQKEAGDLDLAKLFAYKEELRSMSSLLEGITKKYTKISELKLVSPFFKDSFNIFQNILSNEERLHSFTSPANVFERLSNLPGAKVYRLKEAAIDHWESSDYSYFPTKCVLM